MRTQWFLVATTCACLVSTAQAEKRRPAKRDEPREPQVSDAEMAKLTRDPVLGKADRITGTERKGMVAFTFDDGPNPATTPDVIEALVKYDVPATFFLVTRRLVGSAGARSRELLARELSSGFQVASHTVSHPDLRRASDARLAKEIDQSIVTLSTEAKRPIGLFRAPFGSLDKRGHAWLKKRGLTEARWSIDTLDWKAKDADRLRKKVVAEILASDGGVVLMHDVKPITAKVIPQILDDLEAENCRRLASKKAEPIYPVSIHYFLRDDKKPRSIPDDVKKRTEAYKAALPGRCARRK